MNENILVFSNKGSRNLELVHIVDYGHPECRILAGQEDVGSNLDPGDEIFVMGYEPGVSYLVREREKA